ncbi:MAG: TRAP transporter fused permease subunit [Planctomycetota bacterium]|nr:TRAP transporter fused permease subunit [Planctomycetota bacterium]
MPELAPLENRVNEPFEKGKRLAFNTVAAILSLFVLTAVNFNLFDSQPNLALFGMLGLVLVILNRPSIQRWGQTGWVRCLDLLLIGATIVSFGFVFVQSEPRLSGFWVDGVVLGDRAGNETTLDYVIALIGLLLVLETTRRAIGWTLPILSILFILYAMFGPSMPDWLFPHAGLSWERIVQKSFLQTGGVFGIALRVMFMYVFLFVLFGTLLEQTGATQYVINVTRSLFRNSTGGPAKVAVLSSGLMGSLSGSAVANTATTGTFTIPLMKSSGFKPVSAAGIEAAASSGGALMPPIMGAGAYMMLEMVEPTVSYVEVIQAALIPAVLYYVALLLTVHFHAKRIGAAAQPEEWEGDGNTSHFYQGFLFFSSFLILIVMLIYGYTAFRAVSVSLIGILLLSLLNQHTRLTPSKVWVAMSRAGKSGMTLIAAACCVGIILAIVDQTGIGATLPEKVQALANDSSLVALLLLMVSTIILGMGLPSAVCYLLMAILLGSVLSHLQTAPLAAHLFIFYFGILSMVTPPVALAAYAAAAIAKADVMRSALAAFRFSLVGFALPYAFVLRPELVMLTADNEPASFMAVLVNVLITLFGIFGLAAGISGYAFQRISLGWQIPLLASSLALFFLRLHGWQLTVQIIAIGFILLAMIVNLLRKQEAVSHDRQAT